MLTFAENMLDGQKTIKEGYNMSFKDEANKVEESGQALQSALSVPIVKYVVIGVLVIVGMFAVKLLFL